MKKLLFFFLLIIMPLFNSCRKGVHVANPILLLADSLMQSRPDSSLYLLEEISEPQEMKGEDQALYNLLFTQAKYKNCVSLQNDSSIRIALEYYKNNRDKVRLAKSYFYLGCVHLEQKNLPAAIESYLKAVDAMPVGKDSLFMAMIYSHLGDCYSEQDLNETAFSMYKKEYSLCILNDSLRACYSLKNMGDAFLMEYLLDSTYHYYQQALKVAQQLHKPEALAIIYKGMVTLFNEQGKYTEANSYVTKALAYTCVSDEEGLTATSSIKGDILKNLNIVDSAVYYWSIGARSSNIYVKTSSYYSLYQESKRIKDWENSVLYADSFITYYDSIQAMNDRAELDSLMDNHMVELHKYKLSVKNKQIIEGLITAFVFLAFTLIIVYLWRDRQRQKRYLSLQQQLMENRAETMLLHGAADVMIDNKDIELFKLEEERFAICFSLFKETEGYKRLCELEKATPRVRITLMMTYRLKIIGDIRKSFVDVMTSYKVHCTTLTNEDLLFCILTLLNISKDTILVIMNSTPDAIKTRKNRIKNKMGIKMFERTFNC